jgi:hypothetical protein
MFKKLRAKPVGKLLPLNCVVQQTSMPPIHHSWAQRLTLVDDGIPKETSVVWWETIGLGKSKTGKNVKLFRVSTSFFILLKPFMRMASYGGRSLTIAFENGMLRGVRGCAPRGGYALPFLLVVGCWLLVGLG